jgi:quinol monooxygenase YgiN
MSYLITIKFPNISATDAEKTARDQQVDRLKGIGERASQQHGAIHHAFTEDTDGSLLVVDEWPDEEAWRSFFADQEQELRQLIEAMGGSPDQEPEVITRRILDTPDRF